MLQDTVISSCKYYTGNKYIITTLFTLVCGPMKETEQCT